MENRLEEIRFLFRHALEKMEAIKDELCLVPGRPVGLADLWSSVHVLEKRMKEAINRAYEVEAATDDTAKEVK